MGDRDNRSREGTSPVIGTQIVLPSVSVDIPNPGLVDLLISTVNDSTISDVYLVQNPPSKVKLYG